MVDFEHIKKTLIEQYPERERLRSLEMEFGLPAKLDYIHYGTEGEPIHEFYFQCYRKGEEEYKDEYCFENALKASEKKCETVANKSLNFNKNSYLIKYRIACLLYTSPSPRDA